MGAWVHMHGSGRRHTDHNQTQLRSQQLQHQDGSCVEPNHSWRWLFKSPTNGKEVKRNHPQITATCTTAIDVSKQSKIQSSRLGCGKDWTHKSSVSHPKPQKKTAFRKNSTQIWFGEMLRNHFVRVQPSLAPEASWARHNKTGLLNPGTSNSDTWRIRETKVSEYNSMSCWY